MTAESFISLLDGVKATRRGWIFPCPAHSPDRHSSGTAAIGEDGRILVKCWAGCTAEAIVAALGLTIRDLFPDNNLSTRELDRARREREARRVREAQEREREGLTIDACRETKRFIRSRRGIDTSTWSDERINQELDDLANAYHILECEGLNG